MRPSLILLATALGVADAANTIMYKRQGDAFDPGETTSPGANCVDAFGPGYVECRPGSATDAPLCINPSKGETCCSNLWGCPANSFCLVEGLCCPSGDDPVTCARENNVSLPPDFGATTTSAPAKTSTSTPASSTGLDTTSTPPSSTSTEGSSTVSSTSSRGTTSTSATTTIAPTGGAGNNTTTRTASSSKPAVTAGASQERVGAVAALFGLVAAIML